MKDARGFTFDQIRTICEHRVRLPRQRYDICTIRPRLFKTEARWHDLKRTVVLCHVYGCPVWAPWRDVDAPK